MKSKFRLLIIFVFFFILLNVNKVFSYELKILGEDDDNDGFIEFYTYVKASEHSKKYYREKTNGEQGIYIQVDTSDYGNRYGNYDITGIIFHGKPLSNYTNETNKLPYEYLKLDGFSDKYYPTWTSNNIRNVAYADTYPYYINDKSHDFLNYSGTELYNITDNGNNDYKITYVNTIDFPYPEYTLINNGDIVKFKYKVAVSVFEKEDISNYIDEDEEGRKYLYVSFLTRKKGTGDMENAYKFLSTIYSDSGFSKIYQDWLTYDLTIKYHQDALEELEKNKDNISATAYEEEKKGRNNAIENALEKKESLETTYGNIFTDKSIVEGFLPGTKGITVADYSATRTEWKFNYKRGYSGVNDYDNRLYIPDDIITKNNDKTLYVNYLEESKTKELSVLYVAPKGKPKADPSLSDAHQISLDKGSTYESINLKKYKDYIISKDDNKEYEEYKIPIEDKKKKFSFIYMTVEELNAKMNDGIEDEELKYKYKYQYLKYLSGSASSTYESLKQSILTGEGTKLESTRATKSITDNKSLLVSFVYKDTKEKTKIQVEVQHVDEKSLYVLPIANYGNKYYEEDKPNPIRKEVSSTKYKSIYNGDAKVNNAYTTLLKPEYIEKNNDITINYNYNGKIKIEAYKDINSDKAEFWAYDEEPSGRVDFSPSEFANSGYSKILITYFYNNNSTPEDRDDKLPEFCPTLRFSSNFSSTKSICEDGGNFYIKPECLENEDVEKSLYIPTDKEFAAEISTPKYYINEDLGIIQKVTFKKSEIKILVKRKYKLRSDGGVCGHLITGTDANGKPFSKKCESRLDNYSGFFSEEYERAKEQVEMLYTIAAKKQEILGHRTIVAVTEPGDNYQVEEITSVSHGHPSTTVTTGINYYKVFTGTYIKIEVVGFASHYLSDIEFGNTTDDTKFIGTENYNVLDLDNNKNLFNIQNYKEEMIKEIKNTYETGGFSPIFMCNGDPETGECQGWLHTDKTVQDSEGTSHRITFDYLTDDGYFDSGPLNKLYCYYPENLYSINKNASSEPVKSIGLKANGNKYNGERLSIANVSYNNYGWIEKDPESNNVTETITKKYGIGSKIIIETNSNYSSNVVTQTIIYPNDQEGPRISSIVKKVIELDELEQVVSSECTNPSDSCGWCNSAESCGMCYGLANYKFNLCADEKMINYMKEKNGVSEEELLEEYGLSQYHTPGELWQAYNSSKNKETSYSDLNSALTSLEGNVKLSEKFSVYDATKTIEKGTNSSGVNIMNPAELDSIYVSSTKKIVSQTLGNNKNVFDLQVGAETTIVPKISKSDPYTLTLDERKNYIGYYVYEFDFPVEIKSQNCKKITEGDKTIVILTADPKKREKDKNSIDEISGDDYYDFGGAITIIPTGKKSAINNADYLTSTVKLDTDTIYCTAVTKNVPTMIDITNYYSKWIQGKKDNEILNYVGIRELCSEAKNYVYSTNNEGMTTLEKLGERIRNDSRYFSKRVSLSTTNISRLYDFRVTDCTDVNFKNVFRRNEEGVNKHTGIVYFSGIRKLDVYYNSYKNVDNKNNIIPLGPYKAINKNANLTYVEAPKLGYRISFDLKTSGYYRPNSGDSRTIVIFPKLYYISKDGSNFKDNVTAYYKDSTGKYVKIDQATNLDDPSTYINFENEKKSYSGYEITYVPNDGYRNVLDKGITNIYNWFSTNQKTLNMSAIKLTKEMMCTNYDGFIQSWYGEYKLPNSTILVENGKTNLNDYLKDGYCGVVFYIGVVEKRSDGTIVMSYNTSDKQASSQYNTTQWDYEGFLGYPQSQIGSKLQGTLKLQLAKGIWNINNDIYQKVKGTVLLYDLDNRAASDFE